MITVVTSGDIGGRLMISDWTSTWIVEWSTTIVPSGLRQYTHGTLDAAMTSRRRFRRCRRRRSSSIAIWNLDGGGEGAPSRSMSSSISTRLYLLMFLCFVILSCV